MKQSMLRVAMGMLGVALLAVGPIGCTVKGQIPPDQMARIEAAANKTEAAANKATAAAQSASDAAARAEAALAKIQAGFSHGLHK